jgi:hypothetical protein
MNDIKAAVRRACDYKYQQYMYDMQSDDAGWTGGCKAEKAGMKWIMDGWMNAS